MIDAFPLSWPAGWPRATSRKNGKFRDGQQWISVNRAVTRVLTELRRLDVDPRTIVISSNVETKSDGLPRSDRRVDLPDPGVAVYWIDPSTKQQQCMAIDIYAWVSDNIAAVAATLDAMRAIERHGGAQIMNRAFQGFKALPSAGGTTLTLSTGQAATLIARLSGADDTERCACDMLASPMSAVLALRLAKSRTHPDAGGRNQDWTLLQEAERIVRAHHGGAL